MPCLRERQSSELSDKETTTRQQLQFWDLGLPKSPTTVQAWLPAVAGTSVLPTVPSRGSLAIQILQNQLLLPTLKNHGTGDVSERGRLGEQGMGRYWFCKMKRILWTGQAFASWDTCIPYLGAWAFKSRLQSQPPANVHATRQQIMLQVLGFLSHPQGRPTRSSRSQLLRVQMQPVGKGTSRCKCARSLTRALSPFITNKVHISKTRVQEADGGDGFVNVLTASKPHTLTFHVYFTIILRFPRQAGRRVPRVPQSQAREVSPTRTLEPNLQG